MTRRYDVAHVEQLDRIPVGEGGLTWRPIRRRFEIRAFGANGYTAERAGDEVVETHTEKGSGHEELYVVVSGHATFTLGGEEVDAPAGTCVFLRDPAVERGARAIEAGTTVVALGGRPGAAFEPSAWEHWFVAYGKHGNDPEQAIAVLEAGRAEHPANPVMLYHIACFHARAGRTDEAIDHLRRALELGDHVREWAAADEDFDAIRADPRFPVASSEAREG